MQNTKKRPKWTILSKCGILKKGSNGKSSAGIKRA
jgi:hypothetical protein